MTKVKIGKKEYKIYFAMEPTVKSGILSKMARLQDAEMDFDNIGNLLGIMTELLLVGLQKFHREEFGYKYDSEEEKDAAMSKAYSLMDEIADSNDEMDYIGLYNKLQKEMLENGFFAKMFRQELEKAQENTAANIQGMVEQVENRTENP